MIIGRGLLANALREIDDQKILFYVNGISNSVLENIPKHNFEIEEIERIGNQHNRKTFVYFSTSQVNSPINYHRAYVKHKLFIEQLIMRTFPHYLIVRTTNLVGWNPWNTHTLFNYLYQAITVNQQITINPVLIRNFLDAQHLITLLKEYMTRNQINKIIEIINPVSFTMAQIVIEFEKCFSKRFHFKKEIENTDFAVFELNDHLSQKLFERCEISTENYIPHLLKKYYLPLWVGKLNA